MVGSAGCKEICLLWAHEVVQLAKVLEHIILRSVHLAGKVCGILVFQDLGTNITVLGFVRAINVPTLNQTIVLTHAVLQSLVIG